MTMPFVGEIRMFGFGRTPSGWLPCDGRILPIPDNDVLFTLIGTTYGGNGTTNFALPDLRGRLPMNQGQGPTLSPRVIGQVAGSEQVTLTSPQLPPHTHLLAVTTVAATADLPSATVVPGAVSGETYYVSDITDGTSMTLSPSSVSASGGDLPHENCMPTLTVQYCIAIYGIFPSQS
ncbi:phage tail protein [Stenotrophomonas sp. LGBM10]|uniref:phage tail protein n=1 Tax=Stenotrophomonas sp. LGBM10 TaxID=3390038 RepID=UPI00398BAD29